VEPEAHHNIIEREIAMEPEQVSNDQPTEAQPVNPLIPEGIENLVLSCVICKGPVPARRASSRSKDTCGAACNQILRKFRKWKLETSHCPACYHPSTPEQRKEFIQWRKWRGDRRDKPGRPKASQEEVLRRMLQETIGFIKGEVEMILECNTVKDENGGLNRETMDEGAREEVEKLEEMIQRAEKLIDTSSTDQSTLTASGLSA